MPPRRAPYNQDDVENAYLDVTDNHLSMRKACAKHGVPKTTLWNRLNGIRALNERSQEQRLSPAEERSLAEWIVRQDRVGYAPSHSVVKGIAQAVLE